MGSLLAVAVVRPGHFPLWPGEERPRLPGKRVMLSTTANLSMLTTASKPIRRSKPARCSMPWRIARDRDDQRDMAPQWWRFGRGTNGPSGQDGVGRRTENLQITGRAY